ncbi:MAG: hypothetical protein ACP5OG_02325 [Candidatus Nanoarchaeia archaeon]
MLNLLAKISFVPFFWIILLIGLLIYLVFTLLKWAVDSYKAKRTHLWTYKDYKENSYLLKIEDNLLLDKLAKGNYTPEEINTILSDYNSINPISKYPLTPSMVEFEKQSQIEKKPVKEILKKKSEFVNNIQYNKIK